MARNGNGGGTKNALAERAQGVTNGKKTIRELLNDMAPEIKRALPRHMDTDRLLRVALTVIRTNPDLQKCKAESLLGSIMQAAQLGLEPGQLGHCYIVPYKDEATFIIGYRGMIDLARRSGNIEKIAAREVYENDRFELEFGIDDKLRHVPWHLREDETFEGPGAFRGCYMVAKFRDGGHQIHYMPKAEIEQHRDRSAAKNSGPWKTDYIEMAKKTVVRAGWKWLPISIEIMQTVEDRDGSVAHDVGPDGAINVTPDWQTAGDEAESTTIEPPGGWDAVSEQAAAQQEEAASELELTPPGNDAQTS